MSLTTQLTPDRMPEYFEKFTKHFLRDATTDAADIELLSSELGDQVISAGSHVRGIAYEQNDNVLEVELEGGDVRTVHPKEVWVIEEEDGFLSAVEIVRDDDARELIRIRRQGLRPRAD